MFSIAQIVWTHSPDLWMDCTGCRKNWSPDHVLEVLEANGHNTTTNIPQNRV